MQFETASSPHLGPSNDVGNVMRQVLYALVPGTAASAWYFGWGVLINIVLACLFAVTLETLALKLRRRPLKPALTDYSAVVTAWLLALTLPQLSPWWLILTGVFFCDRCGQTSIRRAWIQPLQPCHGRICRIADLFSYPYDSLAYAHFPSGKPTRLYRFIDHYFEWTAARRVSHGRIHHGHTAGRRQNGITVERHAH